MKIFFQKTLFIWFAFLMIGCAVDGQSNLPERPFPTHPPAPTATHVSTQTTLPPTTQPPTATTISPSPTLLPFPGTLLFSSRRFDTNGDGVVQIPDAIHIYQMILSTGKITRLTSGDAYNTDPTWSPDGTQIAFVSTRSGDVGLFMMKADGSDIQQLVGGNGRMRHPAWSPDGTQIVYSGGDFTAPSLFVYGLADGRIQQLTSGEFGDSEPDWSGNGRTILFTRTDPAHDAQLTIHLLDLETNTLHSLPQPPTDTHFSHPRWIPGNNTALSVLQTDSDADAQTTLLIFDMAWDYGTPSFTQRPIRITNATDITWTTNGQWLLGSILRADSADLAIMPIDINDSGLIEFDDGGETAVHLTHDDFFESNLDWRGE